jgi:membrane associated rhomboid family serine protease
MAGGRMAVGLVAVAWSGALVGLLVGLGLGLALRRGRDCSHP